ncbi:MAG: hypothetical protein ACPGJS_06690 [Flammeovirgaceae bacterium]
MQEAISHHFQLSDIEFIDQVFLLNIDPKLFNHEAHIRFAWIVLNDFEFRKAVTHIHDSIKGLDQKFGDGTKYHATITQALIEILTLRMKQYQEQLDFETFMFENQDVLKFCKDLLLEHYSQDLLFSDAAKEQYIRPNRRLFH